MSPSFLRLALVTFASVLAWRLSGGTAWPLLAPLVVVVAQLAETVLLSRFCEAAGAQLEEVADPENGAELASGEMAAAYPWILASLAVIGWGVAYRWPGLVRLEVALGLLCLAHGTAFGMVKRLGWAEAATVIGRIWRERVPLPAYRRLRSATLLWLPKRGLLTVGQPRVDQVESLRDECRPEDVLRLAAALHHREDTPLGAALQQAARRAHLALPRVQDATALPEGTRAGSVEGRRYHLGAPSLIGKLGFDDGVMDADQTAIIAAGGTLLILMDDAGPLGLVAIVDPLQEPGPAVFGMLRQAGAPRCGLLTDEPPEIARKFAAAVGCDESAGEVDDQNSALAVGSGGGPAALLTWAGGYPKAAAGAEATIWLVPHGEAVPDAAQLVIRGDSPAPAALAWSEATATRQRDHRRVRRVATRLSVVIVAAVLGCPLPLLVLLDAAVVLLELGDSLRRVG